MSRKHHLVPSFKDAEIEPVAMTMAHFIDAYSQVCHLACDCY